MRQRNAIVLDDSMDYPGVKREMRFGYNDWGALVKGGVGRGPTLSAAGSRRSIQTVWGRSYQIRRERLAGRGRGL